MFEYMYNIIVEIKVKTLQKLIPTLRIFLHFVFSCVYAIYICLNIVSPLNIL